MNQTKLYLLDKNKTNLGELVVRKTNKNSYQGKIKYLNFPKELKELFETHENLLTQQLFPLANYTEEKIQSYGLILSDKSVRIQDIKIKNKNDISFRVVH